MIVAPPSIHLSPYNIRVPTISQNKGLSIKRRGVFSMSLHYTINQEGPYVLL